MGLFKTFLGSVEEIIINDSLMVAIYNDPFGSVVYFICIIFFTVPAEGAGINRILKDVFDRAFFKGLTVRGFKPDRI